MDGAVHGDMPRIEMDPNQIDSESEFSMGCMGLCAEFENIQIQTRRSYSWNPKEFGSGKTPNRILIRIFENVSPLIH